MSDLLRRIEGWLKGDAAARALPGRCRIDAEGRLRGPANITYNSPWPTPNCTPGGFGTAFGGVFHTEVGYEHSVIAEFNNPAAQASAFFSISMTGAIHQYMALGKDLMAWTQEAGNPNYRGVEHEDHGNPANPLTAVQLDASAQVFEAMSAFDGWPLEPTDNPDGGRGIIFHVDGGAAWGGHNCPGPVREKQRPAILELAKAIRAGEPPVTVTDYTTTGKLSLAAIATAHGCDAGRILRLTVVRDGRFAGPLADYINGVFSGTVEPSAVLPAGLVLRVPVLP